MTIQSALFLVGAGVLAGTVGTAGGITSLVSYPALLSVGVPALPASIANIIAVVACWPGSALASRSELMGLFYTLARLGTVAALGSVAGSLLLLSTPPGVFSRVVPFLLASGSLILVLEPVIAGSPRGTSLLGHRGILSLGLLAVSFYNGYFGAGAGIMTLALVLLTLESRMARANAAKNMLIGVASAISALTFVILRRVDWIVIVPLAAGEFGGSLLGPFVARRLPPRYIRYFASAAGLVMALKMWIWP